MESSTEKAPSILPDRGTRVKNARILWIGCVIEPQIGMNQNEFYTAPGLRDASVAPQTKQTAAADLRGIGIKRINSSRAIKSGV